MNPRIIKTNHNMNPHIQTISSLQFTGELLESQNGQAFEMIADHSALPDGSGKTVASSLAAVVKGIQDALEPFVEALKAQALSNEAAGQTDEQQATAEETATTASPATASPATTASPAAAAAKMPTLITQTDASGKVRHVSNPDRAPLPAVAAPVAAAPVFKAVEGRPVNPVQTPVKPLVSHRQAVHTPPLASGAVKFNPNETRPANNRPKIVTG
jgi:hypothetical protein